MSKTNAIKTIFVAAKDTALETQEKGLLKEIQTQLKNYSENVSFIENCLKTGLKYFDIDRIWFCMHESFFGSYNIKVEVLKDGLTPITQLDDRVEVRFPAYTEEALLAGQGCYYNNILEFAGYNDYYPDRNLNIDTSLIVPIVQQKEIIGALILMDRSREWNDDDVEKCAYVADYIAEYLTIEIENRYTNGAGNVYRTILNHMPSAANWKDKELLYQGCNKSYKNLFGYTESDIIGKTTYEIHPMYYAEDAEHIEKEMLKGDKPAKSKVMKMKNQWEDDRWIRVTRTPIYNNYNEVTNILSVFEDITSDIDLEAFDTRHSQELRHALKQAERANAAKTDFLSRMSHEIRTPLNAVIGLTQVAQESDDADLVQDCLVKIGSASDNLFNIINDLLDMSKIEADKMSIVNAPFDFEAMLDEIYAIITPIAEDKALHLIVEVDYKLPEFVVGDRVHISQVLINLLSNAVKFTDENGVITLSVDVLKKQDDDLRVKFKVEDTGIGMSEKQIKKLFQPFEQVSEDLAKSRGGTGLGLPIARRLVSLMGGEIDIKSKLDEGSTFYFDIPLKVDSESVSLLEQFLHKYDDLTILKIGTHSSDTSSFFMEYLSNMGATFIEKEEEGEILEIIEQYKSGKIKMDVLIVDFSLSGADGRNILKKVADNFNIDNIIVLTSGTDSVRVKQFAEKLEINQVLSRPLLPLKLINAVDEAMGLNKKNLAELLIPDFTGGKILVVEDIDVNREVMQHFLSGTHVEIDEAINGERAVELYEEHGGDYDVVFMDVQMPVMNGYDATIAIRDIERRKHLPRVPIYAMTASAYGADVRRCLNVGMDAHIAKPFRKVQIHEVIAKSLAEKTQRTQIVASKGEVAAPTSKEVSYIDWDEALARFAGDKTFYLSMLENFMESSQLTTITIENAWELENKKELLGELHTIKGTTKNLVLTKLATTVAEIEEKVYNDEATKEDIDKVIDTFNKTMKEIKMAKTVKN